MALQVQDPLASEVAERLAFEGKEGVVSGSERSDVAPIHLRLEMERRPLVPQRAVVGVGILGHAPSVTRAAPRGRRRS